MTKKIGYFVVAGGAIAVVVGLALTIHTNLVAAILMGVGAVAGAGGYYVAKKQSGV